MRRSAVLDDAAILDGQHAATAFGKYRIMRDEHQCRAGGTGGLEQGGDDLLAGAAVQIACRLVRQQDLRACRDGTGNGNTLLLTA